MTAAPTSNVLDCRGLDAGLNYRVLALCPMAIYAIMMNGPFPSAGSQSQPEAMVSTTITPRWLKSTHVTGLDQLGVQIVSIALYTELLPGLTNVTDRIRYYSFYPWLLHRYASDVKKLDETTWQDHLRRAEFLLALVGRLHHQETREGGEAIIGADQATKALAEIAAKPSKVWRLSKWSSVANAGQKGSYFKNKNGGFGQYYRGQLTSLGLISVSDGPLGIKLTKGLGTDVAHICDSQAGRAEFWKAVKQDRFSFNDLAAWGDSLCPCAVASFAEERDFLVKLLFGPDTPRSQAEYLRAQTLRLLLAVLKQPRTPDELDPVTHFRRLAYFEHDPNATRLRVPDDLVNVFHKWSIYETCEFVHYALEVMFAAALEHLTDVEGAATEANRFITDATHSALLVTSPDLGLGTRKALWCDRTLGDILDEAQARQKPLKQWATDPWSEAMLISNAGGQPPLSRLAFAFACLVAIYARNRIPAHPFQAFSTLAPEWVSRHKVTVETLSQYVGKHVDTNAAVAFAGLLSEFVIGQHLRVAMRKLRYQSQATFKLSLEDGRFIWLENVKPTFTNPRLRQAYRFLRDLGLCTGESAGWQLSNTGKMQLRQTDGH
jgi:hypothetical protein